METKLQPIRNSEKCLEVWIDGVRAGVILEGKRSWFTAGLNPFFGTKEECVKQIVSKHTRNLNGG